MDLQITSVDGTWRVADLDQRLPESIYESVDDARTDGRHYLERHGGGTLVVRQDGQILSTEDVPVAAWSQT